MRVSAFIDGFNLYHAIDGTGRHHLKWLDLRRLCLEFAPTPHQVLGTTYYFSAFATWRPDAYARHRVFVAALNGALLCHTRPHHHSCEHSLRRPL